MLLLCCVVFEMPVDAAFSLIGKAGNAILWITNRLHQFNLHEDLVAGIREDLQNLQLAIQKIEPHLRNDIDTDGIKQLVIHLENALESCVHISGKNKLTRMATIPSEISKLHNIQAEIQEARCKLQLFIETNHLLISCDVGNDQNQKLSKISALQDNSRAGLTVIEDKSVRPPSAPHRVAIEEDNGKLILSWGSTEGTVDEYEVCYDEHNECTVPVGVTTTVILESPRVLPGNVYAMRVRGINKGGKGEWSHAVIGQITKPPPQKPEISNFLLRSTMAVVTVKVAGVICCTESPVTCVRLSYASSASTMFTTCDLTTQQGNDTCTFTVSGLQPDTKYRFTVRTKNAEGWSRPSDLTEGNTLLLPPLPAKPNLPVIKVCAPTKVILAVVAPENTCSISSPIVAWRVIGYSESNEEIYKYYVQDENDIMKGGSSLDVVDLDPNTQYTLQLLAKNENGWSEPSEEFNIHIAAPPPPENVRVSSKRTHSLMKIRWNAPASVTAAHYEIVKTTKKGNYDDMPVIVPGNKLSATFTKLNQKTRYYFKVRTSNGFYTSDWSDEIEAKTRIHKAIKATLSPLVWVAGTVAAPLTTPLYVGARAGMTVHESGSNKLGVTAGVTGGAVGGAALGILAAPLVGGITAHYFVHGRDALSDQSDDEGDVIVEDQ